MKVRYVEDDQIFDTREALENDLRNTATDEYTDRILAWYDSAGMCALETPNGPDYMDRWEKIL